MGTQRQHEFGDDPFRAGQTVEGRYRILRRLNAGGVGVVYEAEHSFTGLRVALKALHNQAGDHPERMQAEARTLAEMRHPNIVQVTDGGVTDGVVWFTMELLQGASLREVLHREGALDVERALRFGLQITEGVACAHEQDVIHRDLKPENVFVLQDDSIKVLDFGTSKITNKLRRSGAMKTTDRFRLIGTQAYMPPERLKAERTDARADIYALGHILYEMIAGRHCWSDGPGPLDLPDAIELGMRQIYAPPARLSEQVPGLPREVERTVLRALSKDPRHRQQSMRELGADLQSALAGCAAAGPIQKPRRSSSSGAAAVSTPGTSFETKTEETRAPFSTPSGRPQSTTHIDAALSCGALRFASSSPEFSHVEQGLRAIAAAASGSELARELSLASAECDDRSRAPLRAAVARIGSERGDLRERLISRLGASLTQRARTRTSPERTDIALGAALLLEPGTRSDAAESALLKLGAADGDIQSFALSILVALGRTPLSMHPAPRGALLALLLGAPEDSELAHSELAAFVLDASSLEDSTPPPVMHAPPVEVPTRGQSVAEAAATPTPSGVATPRPSPPALPPALRPPAPVRMGWVIAIATVCATSVVGIGAAVRARALGSNALPTRSANTDAPTASQNPEPAAASATPEPPAALPAPTHEQGATAQSAVGAASAEPPSVEPSAPRPLTAPPTPPLAASGPSRRGDSKPLKLPGSGL
ncbi:MAG: serine/threonine protein kinase [Myxococcales bacterium]|nr:serine/threonine protein kinase [Myxococcales bacterium]